MTFHVCIVLYYVLATWKEIWAKWVSIGTESAGGRRVANKTSQKQTLNFSTINKTDTLGLNLIRGWVWRSSRRFWAPCAEQVKPTAASLAFQSILNFSYISKSGLDCFASCGCKLQSSDINFKPPEAISCALPPI